MTLNEEANVPEVIKISFIYLLPFFCALEGHGKGIQKLESGFMFTLEDLPKDRLAEYTQPD